MNLTEFEAAQRIRDGTLPSPVQFSNMWLVNLRITGTGAAYRYGLKEFVWRDPNLYLNEEFLLRCNGLPVLWDHADEAPMSEAEFKKRIVGSVMLPYIRGDEVWAVVRIYVKDVVEKILGEEVSTSPSVIFSGDSGCIERQEGESNFLIEGVPFLLDHIAVVTKDHGSLGVWDKEGVPEGIEVTNKGEIEMDKEELQNLLAKAVSDALGGVNTRLEAMSARMDSQEAWMKARQDEADKAKQDAEEKEKAAAEEKAKQDAAEKERQDAEEAEAKKKAEEEKAKQDEAEAAEKAKQDEEEKAREDSDMTEARVRCDAAFAACGKPSPAPFSGEKALDYRKRALMALQKYSPDNKDVNIRAVSDAAVLTVLEKAIYADARKAIDEEMNNTQGQLTRRVRMDEAGRRISEYHGDPNVWLAPFKSAAFRANKFITTGSMSNA
ncbi:NUDIX hydrolase [Escherichia coli]|uniref:NUDIX hydrolase n=1 Tax=Escherichia coli TaxID=562 RepID=UPI001919FF6F|nr:NUDIX hydrolase [Escherichia coli]CAD6037078.1 nudix hydrolase [Escherichia coli]CAD6099207.1 nudix hydrolase [Escherichia coli]CAD6176243.1 nudix hydrolase [Escherichia coli]